MIQVSTCPKCGAPIYMPAVWFSVVPPPPTFTCGCWQAGQRFARFTAASTSAGITNEGSK